MIKCVFLNKTYLSNSQFVFSRCISQRMPGYQGGVLSDFGLSRIKIMGIQKSIEEKSIQKCIERLKY